MRLTACLLCLVLLLSFGATPARAEGEIALSATAGFGGCAKIGTYVPIDVTVSNRSAATVSGDVTVTAHDNSGFGTEYVTPVELAPGATKQVSISVPIYELARDISVAFSGPGIARVKTTAKLTALPYNEIIIGVLADDQTTLNHANAIRFGNPIRSVHVVHLTLAELPSQQQVWDNFDLLVINDSDTSGITADQLNALRGWMAEGGTLIVGGGAAWRKTIAGLPTDLLPVEIAGETQVSSLPALANYAGIPFQALAPFTVTTGRLKTGATGMMDGDAIGRVKLDYGSGCSLFLGLDLSLDPIAAWRGNESLWLGIINETGHAAQMSERDYKMQSGSRYHMGLTNALRNIPALALPPVWLLAALGLAYVIVIGPVTYMILKRRDRRDWGWVTIPATALLIVIIVWLGAFKVQGREVMVNQISVVTLRPDLNLRRIEDYVGIFAPTRDDYRISLAGDQLVANLPNYEGLYYDPSAGNGEPPVLMRVSYDGQTNIAFQNMSGWSLRTFATDHYQAASTGIVADLHGQGDSIVGTVTNASEYTLTDCRIFTIDGVQQLGDMAPGASVEVSLSVAPNPNQVEAYATLYNPAASFQGKSGQRAPVQTPEEMRKRQILDGAFEGQYNPGSQVRFIGWLEQPLGDQSVKGSNINAANLALVTQDLSYQPWLAGRYTLPAGMTQTTVIGQSGPEVSSWQRGLHVGNGSRIEVMAELTDYRPMTVDRLAILAYFGSNSTAKPTSGPTQPATTYEVEVWNYARNRYDKVTLTTGVAHDLTSPGDYISPDGYVRLAIEAATGSWFDAQRIGFTVSGREVR